jgi:hypothetical protein
MGNEAGSRFFMGIELLVKMGKWLRLQPQLIHDSAKAEATF